MANLYQIQYTISVRNGEQSENVVDQFEAVDNSTAVTAANSRIPAGATNKKLYNIGTEISLE